MNSSFTIRAAASATVFILLIALGVAAVARWQGNEIDRHTTESLLDVVSTAQTATLAQKQARQRELAGVLVNDASFSSYIAQALSETPANGKVIDTVSIHDLLQARCDALHLDSVALIDGNSRVIAIAGDGFGNGQDLGDNPMLQQTLTTGNPQSDLLENDRRALWVTFNAIARLGDVNATLMTGLHLDDGLMKEMRRSTHADLAIVDYTNAAPRVVAASFDTPQATAGLQTALGLPSTATIAAMTSKAATGSTLGIGGEAWSLRATSLPGTERKLALLSFVTPAVKSDILQATLKPLACGAVALLIALLLAFVVLWRQFVHPLSILDDLAERAAGGDCNLSYRGSHDGVVGRIGSAFNHVLSDLRRLRSAPDEARRKIAGASGDARRL